MNFEIDLPIFHGPFDLLLFFIERDELDIKDIPISKITDDFLDYIHRMETLNVDLAGEFIVVAATLMHIKAKMLLPRVEKDQMGNDIDPRDELVKHLLEYKKYKSVVENLMVMEQNRSMLETRGNVVEEVKLLSEKNDTEAELQDLDLYKLLKVYLKAMQQHELRKTKHVHTVLPYAYTIESQKQFITNILKKNRRLSFEDIIYEMPRKIAVIFNFLAILEMLQQHLISIQVGEGYNNFWIFEKENLKDEV